MNTKVVIRKAVKKDVPALLRLVLELAKFEQAPDSVEVTLSEMETDGFGANPIFSAFVAEIDNKIVGMALYYIKYSTWKGKAIYLDDIIVSEPYRGRGIGGKLFEAVIGVCKELGLRKMDWQVLHWNESAINFYKKYNSVFSNEWLNGTLYEGEIKSVEI